MVDPRFSTRRIVTLVFQQALEGDVRALEWLERHGFLHVNREGGKVWLNWDQDIHDDFFFSAEETPPEAPP